MNRETIAEKLDKATANFLKLHMALLTVDVNERSITHKFAECLTDLFPGWDVDCEYNRDGYEPKRIGLVPQPTRTDDEGAHTVFPDIIVHHRLNGGSDNNLLVIEAKKDPDARAIADDKEKIERIMGDLGYQFGVFLSITTGDKGTINFEFVG